MYLYTKEMKKSLHAIRTRLLLGNDRASAVVLHVVCECDKVAASQVITIEQKSLTSHAIYILFSLALSLDPPKISA